MSDFLATLLIMIGVGLLILIPSACFGGVIGVSISSIVLTIISCFLLMYATALGRSFSNSNASVGFNLDIILNFISFAALYAFMGYSSFCFAQVADGVNTYQIKLLVCVVILFGYPIFLFISSAVSLHSRLKKNYSNKIIIAHAKDFPILIDRLKFFDSKTKKSSYDVSRFLENDRKTSEIEGLSDDYEFMQCQRYYTQLSHTLIPISFDSFELSWYSVLENKFYRDIFPIDQKKLKADEDYDGQLTISDLLIHILPNGHVDLLKKEYTDYTHLTPYYDIAFSSVEGESIESIWKNNSQNELGNINFKNLNNDFKNLKAGTLIKLSPKEILSFRSVYAYGIDIEIEQKSDDGIDLKNVKIIDFYLNQYSRTAGFLKEIITKPLPSFIRLEMLNNKDERSWFDIFFDKKTLFNQYTTFIKTHNKDVFFNIKVNISDLSKSKICLKSKDEQIALDNWSITDRF